jgi:hypothetical protein
MERVEESMLLLESLLLSLSLRRVQRSQIMEFLGGYWDTYVTSVTGDTEINDDEFATALEELNKYIQSLKSAKFPDPSIVGQWDETIDIESLLHTLRSVTTVHDLHALYCLYLRVVMHGSPLASFPGGNCCQ